MDDDKPLRKKAKVDDPTVEEAMAFLEDYFQESDIARDDINAAGNLEKHLSFFLSSSCLSESFILGKLVPEMEKKGGALLPETLSFQIIDHTRPSDSLRPSYPNLKLFLSHLPNSIRKMSFSLPFCGAELNLPDRIGSENSQLEEIRVSVEEEAGQYLDLYTMLLRCRHIKCVTFENVAVRSSEGDGWLALHGSQGLSFRESSGDSSPPAEKKTDTLCPVLSERLTLINIIQDFPCWPLKQLDFSSLVHLSVTTKDNGFDMHTLYHPRVFRCSRFFWCSIFLTAFKKLESLELVVNDAEVDDNEAVLEAMCMEASESSRALEALTSLRISCYGGKCLALEYLARSPVSATLTSLSIANARLDLQLLPSLLSFESIVELSFQTGFESKSELYAELLNVYFGLLPMKASLKRLSLKGFAFLDPGTLGSLQNLEYLCMEKSIGDEEANSTISDTPNGLEKLRTLHLSEYNIEHAEALHILQRFPEVEDLAMGFNMYSSKPEVEEIVSAVESHSSLCRLDLPGCSASEFKFRLQFHCLKNRLIKSFGGDFLLQSIDGKLIPTIIKSAFNVAGNDAVFWLFKAKLSSQQNLA